MIALVIAGVGFIVVVAFLVGTIDAARSAAWRRVAAERRERWEARQPLDVMSEYHGSDQVDPDWDDD